MCEILAPSGGRESAIAAIISGADAIYLGLSEFSARSSAENFDLEGFKEISALARAFGVKVYVAMNTLIKDCELENFLQNVADVWNCGADGIILSDIFLGRFIKSNCPEIKLHLSTQGGVCNVYGANLAKKYGFDRVILARETSFSDICRISKIIETEVFVQGALCTCFSGQCYMSSFAGGNSGNRGKCKQPCRKKYSLDRAGFEEPRYRLSLSDLCAGENIFKLIDAGVKSFKIEGRMRRPEYVAAAVKYYKNILNFCSKPSDFSDLKRTFNRGNYTSGLTFGQDKSLISSAVQGHIGEFVGIIKVENGKYVCLSNLNFEKGDCFKILRDGKEAGGGEYGEKTKNGFTVISRRKLCNGDKVFITTDVNLSERLLSAAKKIPVEISANFMRGEKAEVCVNGVKFYGETVLSAAKTQPLDCDEIKNCFKKTDKYHFEVIFSHIMTDGVFMASAQLNALRRKVYSEYFELITANKNKKVEFNFKLPPPNLGKNDKKVLICENFTDLDCDILIWKPDNYSELKLEPNGFKGQKFLYLPPFMTGDEIEKIIPAAKKFDGIYCDGTWAIDFCERLGKPLFGGCGMNISNCVDISECPSDYIALSKELTAREQADLAAAKTFALCSGAIKVMDLIYCPFGKKCADCDKRKYYVLTDEEGRRFPLRRYKTEVCRFEAYNCAYLTGEPVTGVLIDATGIKDCKTALDICGDIKKQQEFYKNHTRGHGISPVL